MKKTTPTVPTATDSQAELGDDLELLTINEVAEKLKLKPWAVSQLLGSGDLPSIYLGPKTRRIKPADLRAYIDSRPSTRPEFANAAG